MDKSYCSYIVASKRKGALYVGLTANLAERVQQHKAYQFDGFTSQYNINQLVYFEYFPDLDQAAQREHQIKQCTRQLKLDLIETENPNWLDLYEKLLESTNQAEGSDACNLTDSEDRFCLDNPQQELCLIDIKKESSPIDSIGKPAEPDPTFESSDSLSRHTAA